MEKITGKNNDIIKNVKKLLSSSGQRGKQGLFVLEGARLVFDILNSFYKVKYFLITPCAYEKYRHYADRLAEVSYRSYLISDDVSAKLSDTKNPQGVYAVCSVRSEEQFEFVNGGRFIALDCVSDPGNLGSMVRSAEALGIDGVIVGGGCDIYNPKALRGSMGSMLRINILQCKDLRDQLLKIKSLGMPVYATTPDSCARSVKEVDFSSGGLCVIGNEANGVSDEIRAVCDESITIKMQGRAESLNASAAAAIVMWEMLR